MRLILTSLLGAALLAVTSAVPIPRDSPATTVYFATQIGAKWVYVCKSDGNDDKEWVETVANVEQHDGVNIITLAFVSPSGIQYPHARWAVSEKGVTLIENLLGETLHKPRQELRLPSKPGQAWEVSSNRKVIMTAREPESVKVPAGDFEAIGVEERNTISPEMSITRWYSVGVGLIKQEKKGTTITLKSFSPGAP